MTDKFEIVFSFDTTGSMYSCLEEVRRQLGDIVQELRRKIPGIRIAIFAHGDYCDAGSTYVTKYINFSNDSTTLCDFVKNVSRTSGGDTPECYELVMREVQEKLSWSTCSQKALVLIGDAPPHEKSETQNYRHLDWKEETTRLRDRDIKIYAVECNGNYCENFYQYIAARSFGYFMPLSNFNEVKKLMLQICFREAGLDNAVSVSSSDSAYYTSGSTSPTATSDSTKSVHATTDDSEDDDDDDIDDMFAMYCFICKKKKPVDEFPINPVSDDCNHFVGYCLRCIVAYVKENRKCPYDDCNVIVDPNCEHMKFFEAKLDRMFVDYSKIIEKTNQMMRDSGKMSVFAMNGDTAWIDYRENMTITEIKREVESQLGIKQENQKILYNEKGLKAFKSTGQHYTLKDYGINESCSLSLIVPLYCIPENLDHVVFDLSWEFPASNPDFLDATCFAFERTEFIQVIDWNHSTNDYYLKGAVEHSTKNVKTAGGKFGHQTIHVYLKRLPASITHLYFTLSSWKSPNLKGFKTPRLQFYEASSPGNNLCSTTIGHALNHQAVVMCSVVRAGRQWQIFECDASGCVDGNAKRYNPIRQRISEMIANE
ncbi:hypothetical protein ACF0H5_012002 [Mactra antiquata]